MILLFIKKKNKSKFQKKNSAVRVFVTLQNMLVFHICLCYFKEVFKTLIENLILRPFEIDFMFLPINFH